MTEMKNKIEVMSVDEPVECFHCKSRRLFYSLDRGEIACLECGSVVVTRKMDRGAEWRAFSEEERERRRRTGPPLKPSIINPSLISSTIDLRGKDYTGRTLTAKQKFNMIRLKKWQSIGIGSSTARNIAEAVSEIDRLTILLNLSNLIRDEALMIYKTAVNKGLTKGRSVNGIAAASIYYACRKHQFPITLDEISKYSEADRKDIARLFRLLIRETNLKISVADPIAFIEKFIEVLRLKRYVFSKAKELLMKAKEKGLTAGKDPAGIAAATIYIVATLEGENITQKDVARVAGVTEVTVRNRLREMIKKLNISGIDIKLEKEEPKKPEIPEVHFYIESENGQGNLV
jgi:transcription initiation factor TFIIB